MLPLGEPSPCSPAAETALHPLLCLPTYAGTAVFVLKIFVLKIPESRFRNKKSQNRIQDL